MRDRWFFFLVENNFTDLRFHQQSPVLFCARCCGDRPDRSARTASGNFPPGVARCWRRCPRWSWSRLRVFWRHRVFGSWGGSSSPASSHRWSSSSCWCELASVRFALLDARSWLGRSEVGEMRSSTSVGSSKSGPGIGSTRLKMAARMMIPRSESN